MKRAFERLHLDNSKKLKEQPSPSISFSTELGQVSPTGVGGDHPAWDIIIRKLDFQSQMKLSHQSYRLGKFPNSFLTAMISILEGSRKRYRKTS